MCRWPKVKANCANKELIFTKKTTKKPGNAPFSALTEKREHDKMFPHADVVELVDSLDLGSNARACRFESCHPHQKPTLIDTKLSVRAGFLLQYN